MKSVVVREDRGKETGRGVHWRGECGRMGEKSEHQDRER